MDQQTIMYEIDPYRWITIVVTLSLDVAAPYSQRMAGPLPENCRDKVRRIIEELRACNVDPEVSSDYALKVLRWVSEQYGSDLANDVYRWGRLIFQSGEVSEAERSVMLWNRVVRSSSSQSQVETSPPFIVQLRHLLSQMPPVSVYNLRPSSSWDLAIYAWREYDRFYTPMDSVQTTIDYYTFLSAWTTTRRDMPLEADLIAAENWGREVARLGNLSLDRLGNPRTWLEVPVLKY